MTAPVIEIFAPQQQIRAILSTPLRHFDGAPRAGSRESGLLRPRCMIQQFFADRPHPANCR
jgi:hypothetical protein